MEFNLAIRSWLLRTFLGLASCSMLPAPCHGQPFDALRVAPLRAAQQDAPAYISAVNDRVVVRENQVFLADGNAGLRVFSLRDPANPDLVAAYGTGGFASSVRILGKRLYVINAGGGLAVFKIVAPMTLRPLDPSLVNMQDLLRSREEEAAGRDNSPRCLAAIVEGRVYIAREDFGVAVIEMQSGGNARRLGAQPAGDGPVALTPWAFAVAAVNPPISGSHGFHLPAMDRVADELAPSMATDTLWLQIGSATLELTARLEGDVIMVRIAGAVGQTARVQKSASVVDGWMDWETVTLEQGTIELRDEHADGAGQIFYRAISD